MSGYGTEARSGEKPRDPLLRFLGGCAIVVAVVLALAVCVVVGVGWQLTRDETPGRAPEAFLVGDETRYWRIDLAADDAGLTALFARFSEINDERRRALLRGTFLEHLPLPSREAKLTELAPLTLEIALVMSDPVQGPQTLLAWSGRGTVSHGLLRMRAAIKLIRWLARSSRDEGDPVEVDGIAVTRLGRGLVLATVGNRVLVASDTSRLRAVLQSAKSPNHPPDPRLIALHDDVKLDGEDAWAFAANVRAGGSSTPVVVGGVAASFDINDRDELAFRIAVLDEGGDAERGGFSGTREHCLAVASLFLPRVPLDAIDIDEDRASAPSRGARTFTGRIAGLSKRLAALIALTTDPTFRESVRPPPATETPSATPTPPSPPPPAGPRTGTAAGPKREGSPRPPR